MATRWLTELANESLGDFAATPEIDRDLSLRALRARQDREEAWALFTLLAWKINRFAGRFRHWRLDPWELDDIVQETYFVFLDTLRRWTPRYADGCPAGYLFYFLAVFPRWLQNATRPWLRRNAGPRFHPDIHAQAAPDADRTVVDDFCARLTPPDERLVRLHVFDEVPFSHAAAALSLPRNAAYTRWRRVIKFGREYLREAG